MLRLCIKTGRLFSAAKASQPMKSGLCFSYDSSLLNLSRSYCSMSTPSLTLSPDTCLHDELVNIRVAGLQPGESYTLSSTITDAKGVPFFALAHYKADPTGVIDPSIHPADGGHFNGVQPMGLIANIIPDKSEFKHHRFSYKDVTVPQVFDMSVYKGSYAAHIAIVGAEALGLEPVCRSRHERQLMAPGVRRIPVKHGKVRGTLFLPPGDGPFPGVIDMFGSAGGLMEHRAAMLASRGIASLALAFFGYQDLPTEIGTMEIGYFQEATDYLLSREEVISDGIGAIGVSKGGDMTLTMALNIPQIKAIMPINGCISNIETKFALADGTVIPALRFDLSKVTLLRDGAIDCYNILHDPDDYPESMLPIEDIPGSVMWIVGLDDRNWKSEYYADLAVQRCREQGRAREDKLEVIKYPGAGHLIEPPYVPFCEMSYHKIIRGGMMWGGRPQAHCDAQVDAWKRCIAFFKDKLAGGRTTKSKL